VSLQETSGNKKAAPRAPLELSFQAALFAQTRIQKLPLGFPDRRHAASGMTGQ
jgi:hypothetical protein